MNAVYADQPMTARRARMIARRGEDLIQELNRLGEGADLPEWLQAKIENAYQMIDSAFDYLEQMDEIEEISETDLLKARATKYTYRKRIGTNPKTGAATYRYYYNKPKTGRGLKRRAEGLEEGSSFVFHHRGKRGHFHVENIKGNKLQIVHDETGHSVEVTKKELYALLLHEHKSHLEEHAEHTAKRAVERGRKTKSGTHKGAERRARRAAELAQEAKSAGESVAAALGDKPKPKPKKKPSAPKPTPSADNFETMPEGESTKEPLSTSEFKAKIEELKRLEDELFSFTDNLYRPQGLTKEQEKQIIDQSQAEIEKKRDELTEGFKRPQSIEDLGRRLESYIPKLRGIDYNRTEGYRLFIDRAHRVELYSKIKNLVGAGLRLSAPTQKTYGLQAQGTFKDLVRLLFALENEAAQAPQAQEEQNLDSLEANKEYKERLALDLLNQSAAFKEDLVFTKKGTFSRARNRNKIKGRQDNGAYSTAGDIVNETMTAISPSLLNHGKRPQYEERALRAVTVALSNAKGMTREEIALALHDLLKKIAKDTGVFERPSTQAREELTEAATPEAPTPSADNFETMPDKVPDGTAFRQFNRRESKALDLYTDEQLDRGLKAIANVLKDNSGFSGEQKEFYFRKYHPAKKPLSLGQRSLEHNRQMARDFAFRDLAYLYKETLESGEAPPLESLVSAFKQAAGEPQQSRRDVTKSLEYKTVHDLYLSLIDNHLSTGSDFAVGLKGLYKKKIWTALDRKEAAVSMAPSEHLKRARLYIAGIKDGFVEFAADSGSSPPVLKTDNLPSDLKGDRFDKLLKHIGLFYQRLVDKHIENKEEANLLARYAESPLADKTPEELEALKNAARVVEAKGENQTDFEKGAVRFILNEIEALTNPRIKSRQMKIEEPHKSKPFTTEERRFIEAFDRISESEAPSTPAAQARDQLIEAATPEAPTPSADNFETMPESEAPSTPASQAREELAEVTATATAEAVESRQPRAEDMSDEELTSAIKRQEAEVLDLETEIKDLKRQRQRYGDKSKKRKAAQAKLNELKTAQASRTGETVALKGEGSKVPAEDEMKSMISKLKKMVEQNPSLAKSPEVMALLGGGATQASNLPDTDLVITLGGKTQNIPVKYKIIEAGDAIGSHHAGGFYKRPDYPEGVQEREYHNARGPEQNKVIVQAQNLNPQLLANTNPDAMNGPPVLTQDGIALGGNSRVMSVQRAYMAHPEKAKAYKTYLYKKAHTFGIDPQELDKFSAPLLVRELTVEDKSKENLAKLVRAMNEGLTQEFDATAEGRNAATKLLGDNVTLKAIAGALRDAPESATLNSILKTPSTRLENIKRALFRDGIMTSRNSNKYIHEASGAFNDTGVSLVKKMITGYVLRDDELLRALSPRTEDNLNNALATLSAVGINREDAEDIQNAVFVYNLILNKDVATGGINSNQTPSDRDKRVKMFMEEDRAFDFGEGASDKINIERLKERVKKSPLSSAFLKILALNPSPRALNSTMKQFVKLVDVSDNMDMFAAAPIDFTAASKQIAQKLADQHKTSAELYKSRVRRGARSARAGLLLALA